MNLFKKENVSGMMTSKIGASPIFEFVKNLDQDTKGSQGAYTGDVEVYTQEAAKIAIYKYLVEDKDGKVIGAEFGNDSEAGYGGRLGNTLIGLRIGLRQKGAMKDVPGAKEYIEGHVDYVYNNFSL